MLGDVYGANPDTFTKVNGSYAFLGGSRMPTTRSLDSSSVLVVDPTATPALHQSGTLSGRLRIRSNGYVIPAATEASDSLDLRLYGMVFKAPTPHREHRRAEAVGAGPAARLPGDLDRTYHGSARSDLLKLA